MQNFKSYFTKKVLTAIVAVGAVIILLLYVFVYMDYSEKTWELERSNRQLRNSLSDLKVYYDNMDKYQEEMDAVVEEVDKILVQYPADTKPEDVIMLAVQLQENADISISAINMQDNAMVYAVPQQIVAGAGIEGLEHEIDFMQKSATYVNITDYDNLKECVEQIYASDNRIGISSITYIKGEEVGTLEGSINLRFYNASGTGKEYVYPDIDEYLSGTDDIFY
ncbi:MAG: hypothetical protein IJ326_10490 [Lachnospiraceae bacterium]|nr:hypothetical protein [Lachnospiraceae bacterium]